VDVPFPKTFPNTVKTIFKRMFRFVRCNVNLTHDFSRVYAHIYYSHFNQIVSLGEEAHLSTYLVCATPVTVPLLDTCFKHFYYFIVEFNLVEKKEMAPLDELITNLTSKDK
jgi:MOB kinase activator 1